MLSPSTAPAQNGSRPPAVILGGKANAVSVARSLAAAGVEVHAIGDRSSPLRFSRACTTFVDGAGDGGGVQAAWLQWLRTGPRGAVLLPCDDDGLELIARNRATLLELGYRPFEADDDVVLAMLDKDQTNDLSRRLGVAVPDSVAVERGDDVAAIGERIGYPCAVKPVHSHLFQRRSGSGVKAFVVDDEAELVSVVASVLELGVEVMVTEIVQGGDDQLTGYHAYLDEGGEPLFELTKRKLRQYPPLFGLGCYQVTDWDPEVARAGLAFMRGVGVRGLANVEFKRDARDGRLRLIECNHRFTAPNEQFRLAGLDMALFAYNRLIDAPLPDRSYRSGVRVWHPIEDTRAFLALRRSGRLSTWAWLRSLMHVQHLPVFRWDDPAPTIGFHVHKALRLRRKLSRRRVAGGSTLPSAPGPAPTVSIEASERRFVRAPAFEANGNGSHAGHLHAATQSNTG